MSERFPVQTPDENEAWEMRVQTLSRQFDYPPTPDIAAGVRARLQRRKRAPLRSVWVRAAVALLLIALVAVLAIPDLRAKAFEILQLGALRVEHEGPTLTPQPEGTPAFDPALETTLDDARSQVDYPVLLPAYPPDLGTPDHVYFYGDLYHPTVILTWEGFNTPGKPPLSLSLYPSDSLIVKYAASPAARPLIHGKEAFWFVQPHVFEQPSPGADPVQRLIEANVLVWTSGDLTLRLETDWPLEEAVRLAESVE
ncbi:hypothetical protein [Aggregatilinea lenta]|uniref:hypothetical protein n=1 Tax=Aggregatilinea lenta TaxID=913108 RepID=UPI000E5C0B49|nr:hypothetical protein [Aggregatilinea lenta]